MPLQKSLIQIQAQFYLLSLLNIKPSDIKKTDDKISLENRLSTLAANNIAGVLNSVNINSFNLNKQNHKDASYCIQVNKSDGRIDFGDSSNNIINKFRA